MPKITEPVASVAISEGMPTRVTRPALIAPMTTPAARPARSASGSGMPATRRSGTEDARAADSVADGEVHLAGGEAEGQAAAHDRQHRDLLGDVEQVLRGQEAVDGQRRRRGTSRSGRRACCSAGHAPCGSTRRPGPRRARRRWCSCGGSGNGGDEGGLGEAVAVNFRAGGEADEGQRRGRRRSRSRGGRTRRGGSRCRRRRDGASRHRFLGLGADVDAFGRLDEDHHPIAALGAVEPLADRRSSACCRRRGCGAAGPRNAP